MYTEKCLTLIQCFLADVINSHLYCIITITFQKLYLRKTQGRSYTYKSSLGNSRSYNVERTASWDGFFLYLHSGCLNIFEKHLRKTANGYVCVAKRCWIKGTYLFNFALLPIGRQGIADIFSALRLLPLAAWFANCTPTAGKRYQQQVDLVYHW